MRVFAAIVPPPAVLDEVFTLVDSVQVVPESQPQQRRGLLGRLASKGQPRGEQAAGEPVAPAPPQLDVTSRELAHLPVSGFGNVTLADSRRLAAALRTAVASWPRPQLHFSGATALEWPGDEAVWAKLGGDVDGLMTVARGVPMVVQRLGFFVDRRQFRPWMAVGTINAGTTAPYLEQLVAALTAHRGSGWVLDHVSLMRRSNEEDGELQFEELEKLRLAR